MIGLYLRWVDHLHRESVSEYHGPCPKCGGRDRFVVFQDTGRFWCRQCGFQGDQVDFLVEVGGFSKREALLRIKGEDIGWEKPRPHRPPPRTQSDEWRRAALGAWRWCSKQTLPPEIERYLRARGIFKPHGKVGFVPETSRRDPSLWGGVEVVLPRGMYIPLWGADGNLVGLRVRTGGTPRYRMVKGSRPCAQEYRTGTTIIVVESDLDAMMIAEIADKHCLDLGVVALGSTSTPWTPPVPDRRVLVATDADEAGDQWAAAQSFGERLRPTRKDPGEMGRRAVTEWLLAAL